MTCQSALAVRIFLLEGDDLIGRDHRIVRPGAGEDRRLDASRLGRRLGRERAGEADHAREVRAAARVLQHGRTAEAEAADPTEPRAASTSGR